MCSPQRRQNLRKFATLTILILTIVVNIGHLCFLGYWVRSEVNNDLPQTPGFSIHMFTNGALAIFTITSIIIHIRMTYMVHRESLGKTKYSCVSYTNIFIMMSFLLFGAISTILYVNFPLYRLAAPFPPRMMTFNKSTGKAKINIPIWLDRFQSKFHCCGAESYIDYKYVVHNVKGMERLPKSCCKKFQAVHPDHKFACEVDAFSMVPESAYLAVHTEGCRKKLEKYFSMLTEIIMCFCWTIFGLSLVSMLAFRSEFKLSRAKAIDEENVTARKCSSQLITASGENSTLSFHHQQMSREATAVDNNNKARKESKPEMSYNAKEFNPTIPQLFGGGSNNNDGENVPSAIHQPRPRKPRRPPTIQQKRSQSHPYDYFSRHGLSNVL